MSNLIIQENLVHKMRNIVCSGETLSLEWRRKQLSILDSILENHEDEIIQALYFDLEKPTTEAYFEVIAIRQELKVAFENLKSWTKPKKIQIPLSLQPGTALTQPEPLGCVLIIGPWNYPFSLTLQPLVSALAAGNTAVLKPSEHASATSKLIHKLIDKYFPNDIVTVIEGNGAIAEELISMGFDHVFFTGGSEIGKKVMRSASNSLTPVTLELGGKSPAIVIKGADVDISAKRITWGKGLNAGQTCIAPDHVLVQEDIKNDLISSMKKYISSFYGTNPINSKNLGKIINDHHFIRLKTLLDNAKQNNQLIFGGEFDETRNRIAPSLIDVKDENDPLMKEEIFGPLIPIISYKTIDESLKIIKNQPKPLALYLFGGNQSEQNKFISKTSSGGICINDVVLQAGIPELPFGGVGNSGMGYYHGLAGFLTFSHQKSILRKPFWFDIKFRYPPYSLDLSFLKKFLG